ncbi:glycosyltransferase [Thermosynechococcaceae cyanobacterium BACA0444]|uniref:Glycosyltransferase n=1 Tax=Pseudocalidococcus azoricus BACA0444 TaxID=2918990 RepID=A0AAE4JX90_9CYAN|nr:glycosyltransferase [Pseudocalidococcus azoricus]MDS3862275.1 glycosyltransferase [Pseudocalidococcus azoricus BACA0444]
MVSLGLVSLSLFIWLVLLLAWGNFWRADQQLTTPPLVPPAWPAITVIIPARNEADVMATSLTSLLNQDYPGEWQIVLVDDQSQDETSQIAQATAATLNKSAQLKIITGTPLPPGWSGKLWALEQGIKAAQTRQPQYLLLTDADIAHSPTNLRELVQKATTEHLALVSLMVQLRCQSFWEKLLIPAFIFFFQKLYPFPWVNNPQRKTAAAAGGCILLENQALQAVGGIEVIRQALIDDCSLAAAFKNQGYRIWLGLSSTTLSLRPYPDLASIWNMVARTAYTQLNYSPWLLAGTLVGMTLVYLMAPLGVIWGLVTGHWLVLLLALLTWALMAIAYTPTIRLYHLGWAWSFALPGIAFLYNLMTFDSARRHWLGQGGAWKGRTYEM